MKTNISLLSAVNGTAPERGDAEAPPAAKGSANEAALKPVRKTIAERIVDLADVEAPGEPPLLFGKYLLKGNAHWLTGQTGLGKSTLMFNIACALAEGKPLWGIDCLQTRILYCDMESGDMGRALKIERLYRDTPRVRGQLLFLREPVKLPEEMPELLAFAQEREIGLVIFDTARRCFSVKDENDNAEFYNRIVPTLDALKLIGIASLTLGHPAKNGDGSQRGASGQADAGDTNLALSMHRGEIGDKNGIISLRVTKDRIFGYDTPPLLLRRIGDDQFQRLTDDDPVHSESSSAKPEKELLLWEKCAVFIRFLLAGRPDALSHSEIVKKCEVAGHTPSTAKKAIGKMQESGQIEHDLAKGYCLAAPPT